jgi:hypothetical protein
MTPDAKSKNITLAVIIVTFGKVSSGTSGIRSCHQCLTNRKRIPERIIS